MFRKEQEPWEYPKELLVPGRILSLSRPSATAAWGSASPSTGIQVQNADSDSGGLSWGLRVCIPKAAGLHTTPELARLWETSQPSLRTPAALTPASLIISFKLTHSWKKEKQTIKTLILPHLWVSFFQHIMSHCDNYATSSCSTYLQPKKQRPSINTCYIISTHWLLSHSLLVYLSVFPIWLSIPWKQPLPCGATWRLTRKEHSVLSADSAQGLHT